MKLWELKRDKTGCGVRCKACKNLIHVTSDITYIAEVPNGNFLITRTTRYDAFDCGVCGCQNIVGERFPKKVEVTELYENDFKSK